LGLNHLNQKSGVMGARKERRLDYYQHGRFLAGSTAECETKKYCGKQDLCMTRLPNHNTLPDGNNRLRLLAAQSRSTHIVLSRRFNLNDPLAQQFILKRWSKVTLR
jgi:hypothetical protein